jgi:hypothetical protein
VPCSNFMTSGNFALAWGLHCAHYSNRGRLSGSGKRVPVEHQAEERRQFDIEISRVCVPLVPSSEKVSGTVSLVATFGTTTLN